VIYRVFFFPLFPFFRTSIKLMIQPETYTKVHRGILILPQLLDNATLGVYVLIHAYKKLADLFLILINCFHLFFSNAVLQFIILLVDYIE
jgi:hypothetical protein